MIHVLALGSTCAITPLRRRFGPSAQSSDKIPCRRNHVFVGTAESLDPGKPNQILTNRANVGLLGGLRSHRQTATECRFRCIQQDALPQFQGVTQVDTRRQRRRKVAFRRGALLTSSPTLSSLLSSDRRRIPDRRVPRCPLRHRGSCVCSQLAPAPDVHHYPCRPAIARQVFARP